MAGLYFYSIKPYFTFTRSSFCSMESDRSQRKNTVDAAWTASAGSPVTNVARTIFRLGWDWYIHTEVGFRMPP